jgi:hypothetical protein
MLTISYMTTVYTRRSDNTRHLKLGQIDEDAGLYADFNEFASDFWQRCSYPTKQSNKEESFGFTPTLFEQSYKTDLYDGQTKFGRWRVGACSSHDMSVMYLDCDNDQPNQPMVTIDAIDEVLRALNYSHLLYTSYSHKPDKHKTRAIMPLSRDISFDEGFLLYVWFNHLFHYQMDGSCYDDGDFLFGPTFAGEKRQWLEGQAIDADALLSSVEALPEQALTYALKRAKRTSSDVILTPERWTAMQPQLNDFNVSADISIYNPTICRREWLETFDTTYQGGSHRQSLFGTLIKIWKKSQKSLSFGDMQHLRDELDARQSSYCLQKYGRDALKSDLRSVMFK